MSWLYNIQVRGKTRRYEKIIERELFARLKKQIVEQEGDHS